MRPKSTKDYKKQKKKFTKDWYKRLNTEEEFYKRICKFQKIK